MLLTPFHAAEQHSKGRISDSAERSDFPMSPVLCEQLKVARFSGPSDWLSFLVHFWTSKNELNINLEH